jgi:hypothetical protein
MGCNQTMTEVNTRLMINGYNLPKAKQSACLCFERKHRFIGGYDCDEEVKEIVMKHFGDLDDNLRHGLKIKYYSLKEQIKIEKKIGLIIHGSKLADTPENYIGIYITPTNDQIPLYVGQICKKMIGNEYIADLDMLEMCLETPNFDVYYYND